jgi:membrane fusion protein (multidrug efflux system)
MKDSGVIAMYILLIVSMLNSSCRDQKKALPAGAAPVQVIPFTIQPGKMVYYDSYPGTVVATSEVQLFSEVTGFVTGLFFKEGGQVNRGEKLYEIDRTKYKAALDGAKANVDIAQSNLQKAQRDADRYKKLDEQNAIAKQILEDALTSLENAKMQVKSATAALTRSESDFNYSLITAPLTGTIGFSRVKPGAFAIEGQTLLNTISTDDPIGVDFIADEKSIPYFTRLQNTKGEANDSTFRIVLADNSDYKYFGKLSIIDRAVDPQTGTIRIRVEFPNKDRILRSGMNCNLKVLNANSGDQISVPSSSVTEQMGEYFVYLIDNNIVRQKRIVIGPVMGANILVKSGINPGDKIVLEGVQRLRDGLPVSASDKK